MQYMSEILRQSHLLLVIQNFRDFCIFIRYFYNAEELFLVFIFLLCLANLEAFMMHFKILEKYGIYVIIKKSVGYVYQILRR